ncbi:talin-2 isoform X1 [Balaenoptera ricei]|uniref:Talin-2 isoform X1 n=1 Tax=Balaenoptera musculus TaxID=9771 RepID=A0A8B8WPE5_BALMU|nr:talin-2 isoform X1 [Balaenoptera musculus]XP_036699126.1 talin-2 isoform X1 [Balaenoptera musculus]XP_036699127.1 talin-2 isoform X1 [Balaenoptera musculus]XP_036699128.1 talin-2 isoform X1 [Balaenoptera musculus]XP_036699129.1 talin-2 isoform X1 [Balaenoptera musculus]XP_036699130.1 talin-2 isoform X1 [Balaenoptera musculus]XP_059769105.1 talin-2 isoform X1 [Balaenoptera ricei]XP_059769106.1 talin-2 isoform X1 [Balaenoptera ricei]XP_059769107.1 talin-2 isoform X1 [Balaenoptera ricei]
MVALSLKICVRHCNVVKTMQFEPSTAVYDACRVIRERVPEAQTGQASDYGLFLSDEDPRKGIWLEAGRTLDYYMLRNGDILEYKKKQRPQKIRMLDGSVKTVMVDDSKTVGELLVTICSRIGITNYEEYSLIQETIEEKKEEGTGTLKKDRTLLRDERKMEKLKAKLHTDDDLNWLDHSRTFREQGVDENETLLLRRKFFYSDQNVDSRDPVQLNLLYVQARDDILNGSHPVSFEKACEFGGFQAQIQFGPHVEHKHKPGFLDLKEFLPKEYIKQRGAEKRIFQEHKNCGEMNEIEAKVKYVKLARSLRTYGVSFFLVKEKMKGKNKLVPRLLGITKDSVMRVDEKTKEVLQEWPLTTVKRWAASPKSFTLDFGEYQESYYSVQTTEGEQISQLIAGYIDIILKKKQSKDRFGLEGDEESTMLEESVSPKKSTILQQQFNRTGKAEHGSVALPAVMRSGSSGPETFNVGSMPSPQQQVMVGQMHRGHMPPLTSAQQALMGTINTSMHAVQQAQDDLSELDSLPPLGQDMASRVWVQNKVDESKHEIHSQVDAITAGTASVVNLTAGDPADTDYTAVGCAITTISSNLTEMSKGVKLLAALMDDEVGSGEDLLRAARTLAGAVSDLLKAVQPTSGEPRQTVLTAAGSIGQASGDLLRQIGENETDERFQDVLMSLAKAVANAAAMLVLKAKNVAQVAEDTVLQNRVIAAATQCALSTSQLVACAKVVSPTISSPVCQEQLIEAGKLVDRSVENCVHACQAATDDTELLKQVSAAASVVSQALHDLLQHVRQFASRGEPIGRYDQATDTIMCVTESIFSSMGDAGEMVRQARVLAQATSDLVNAMRSDAEAEIDMENSKKLLAAAKLLADSTARMVEAAKGAAANPENEDQQQRLREAAEGLRVATNAAAQNAIKKKIVNRLEVAAKQAAAAATQTIAASQNAAVSNKNPAAQQQLVQSCKAVADHIPQLVQGVRGSQAQAEDLSAQLALIISSQNFLQPGSKMVSSAKAAVPTVSDQAAAMQLSQCAKNLATSLAELRTASQKAHEACGPMEIDSALSTVQTLKSELQDAKMAAVESQLKPLPGETLEKCAQDLGSTSKAVGSSMAQLLTCAAQGNEHYTGETHTLRDALRPGVAARETAQALKTLAQAARGVAASTSDPAAVRAMLDSARDVMEGSAMLIQEAKQALIAPGDAESQQRLAQVAKAVSHSLNNCVNCLPGQKDVDVALKSIGESSKKLLVDSLPPSTKPFQEAQSELNQAAADLNQSAGEVVHATRGQSGELAAASGKFSDDFDEFLDAGIEMAGQAQTKEDQIQVIGNLKNISMASSKLLLAAKSLSVDPGAPNAKNLLAAAARAVTESINQLITLCTQQAPGQKECDNALRELETVKGMLDNPNEPVSDLSYFDCIESVMENSKVLGESMAGISQNAKTGDLPAFGECVGIASKALCGLTEAAAQAAYLVGISDPNSQAGHQGLVDPIQFARANQAIQMACQNLVDPGSSPSQVLSAATIVAKHTSALCNACRIASSKTGNPVAKRHFVQSAKEVANSTANLVKTIKALDGDFSEDNRNKCRIATAPLIEAVENLTAFASNPEFVSIPAQISSEGSQAQEPILVSAKTMLESSSYLIRTARSLAINPKDPPTWSVLAGHSHTVSDSIKSLITSIRDKAPGQRECDYSIDSINRCIRDIEQASLAAVSQSLATRDDISVEALQEQLTSVVQEIGHLIDPIATAARGEAAQLGHKVTQLASYFEPLILAAVGVASKILDHQQQMTVLDQTKTLAESALQMLYAAKEGGGNPKAQHTHDAITEAAQLMKEAVDDIMVTLNEAASEVGLVGGMVDAIAEAMSKLDEGTPPEPKGTFVDYQTTVVKYSKAIAVTAQEMMTKSVTNPEELGGLASQMTSDYGHLALQGQMAAATAEPEEIGFQIRTRVQDLGHGCIFLVQKAGALQVCPTDSYTKRELIECARAVTEKVSLVLSALQAGNKGTQACITAATAVSGIIADLDTTIMFATAGTLNAENNETFADHRENILKTAKALVEDTKLLVSGAASTPDKLAQAAQSSAATITQLAEVVKLGAASLGSDDPETQVVLINAIKDVAKALSDLIGATKGAASKPADDPSMYQLKGAAKVMVTNVTSLLKTVKAVEDEATRGTRALEATIEYMKQELTVFQSKEVPEKTSSPEESIRMTKGITMATAKAVAAGNSCRQEDVIATANLSRKAVSDMLTACKQASYHPEVGEEVRTRALRYGTECTLGYLDLLEHVLVILQKPTPELKHQLAAFSKRVAGAVTELIQAAEAMKGTEWVDPEDPTVIAETELLGAAASIEAAAKKLEQLKPRAKPKQADETLDFEEQILEAAKSIAAATSALVKSASAAQRELVAQGKVGSIPANAADDGQWSQGLISAARMVAAATSSLCEAANASVQGHASEEKLISSAKQVAASTAQLLVACKVKADQDSEAMRRLQAAGNAVKRASDNLVRAAQKAAFGKADDDDVVVKTKFVGGIAQIIAAQEEMLKKERELEEARKKLAQIRQQQYKFLPTELREDEG